MYLFFQNDLALIPLGQALLNAGKCGVEGELGLFAGGHILARHQARRNLVVAQKHHIGDPQLVGIVHLGFELFLLGIQLRADTGTPQPGSQLDGRGQVLGHGQDQHIGRSRGQGGVQKALLTQHIKQTGQANGDAHAGKLTVGIILSKVVITSTRTYGTDLRIVQQGCLIHGTGVVVQAPGDGQIHGEIDLRNAEGGQVTGDGGKLIQSLVKQLMAAPVALQGGEHLVIAAGDRDETHDLLRLLRRQPYVVHQAGADLMGPDLVQLVHGAHDVAGPVRQAQHGIEAVEDLAVVDPDLEPGQAQGGEGLVDDGGDLRLVGDVQLAVTDDVDIRLIEFPEAAPLGTLAPVHLADLIPAEVLLPAIKDTELELPVLLAAWLSFSMSEIRGLTKSKSISGDHIRIAEVVVVVAGKDHRKEIAKNKYRNRTHRIPPYIKSLIDKVPGDRLVTLTEAQIYHRWIKFQDEHRFKHMTFHDLRHLNASIMAALRIPDKYAQERGGWKSDKIMKKVYTQTFSEIRTAVDDKIDGYFDNIANPIMENMPWEKYRAWLTLFGKKDNKKSQKEFMKFIEEHRITT